MDYTTGACAAAAAKATGAIPVIIGCPMQEQGILLSELLCCLRERFGWQGQREVAIVGIGPEARRLWTLEAEEAIRHSELLMGAPRMLALARDFQKPAKSQYLPAAVRTYLDAHPQIQRAAMLVSGYIGFYSGSKKLLEMLDGYRVRLVSGISSPIYFCSRLGIPWENVYLMSLHGRDGNLSAKVRAHRLVMVLAGGENDVCSICCVLCENGFGSLKLQIGERLSYPDERITVGAAEELIGKAFDALSLVLIENPGAGRDASVRAAG